MNAFRQADKTTLYMLAALFVMVVMCWGFIELADEMREGETREIDAWILLSFRQPQDLSIPMGPPWLLEVANDVTALGGQTILALFTMLAIGYCIIIHRLGTAALIVAASAGAAAFSTLLKWSFSRSRPDIVPHLVEVTSASFPSGHAMLSAAVYLSLGAIIAQITPGHRPKIYIMSAALLISGLVGVSRLYLGVHFPSDVLAGWSAGLAWAIFCWIMAFYLRRLRRKFWPDKDRRIS